MPTSAPRTTVCLAVIGLLLGLGPRAQAGVVENFAPNKAFLQVQALAQFTGALGDLPPVTGDGVAVASVPGAIGYKNFTETEVHALPALGLGDAQGRIRLDFNAGAGAAADDFLFDLSGIASALSAEAVPGHPLDAQVRLQAAFMFHLDAAYSGLPAGSLAGHLALPALRAAGPYEAFSLAVHDGSAVPAWVQAAGDPAARVPLRVGQTYVTELRYAMSVPFGVDPPFALSVAGTVSQVPEPGAALLLAAGLAGLAGCARPGRPAPRR